MAALAPLGAVPLHVMAFNVRAVGFHDTFRVLHLETRDMVAFNGWLESSSGDKIDDVSLVGFDWFLRWLPSGGALTTVAQPFEEIGRAAARRLFERLRGGEPSPPFHIFLPAPVVVKSTTAPLPSGDVAVSSPLETGP